MDLYYPPPSVFYSLDIHDWSNSRIEQKITATPTKLFYVLNYSKLGISFDDTKTLKYRSVVFSFPEKLPLSFSPPKSVSWEVFARPYMLHPLSFNTPIWRSVLSEKDVKTPPLGLGGSGLDDDIHRILHRHCLPTTTNDIVLHNDDHLHVNEYIDGVMIHLFYDIHSQRWEIATKGGVGGKYAYYGNLSSNPNVDETIKKEPHFYDMFMDACRTNKGDELNDIPFLEYLCKDMCYIFILQHPKNKIVFPVAEPTLYLIRIYYMYSNGALFVSPKCYENWDIFMNIRGIIEFPKRWDFSSKNDVETYFDNEMASRPNVVLKGIVVTNLLTGEHTVIRNKHYKKFKMNKRLQSNMMYRYLCYRRMEMVHEYIDAFPHHKMMFYAIENEYNTFINRVHKCYLAKYVPRHRNIECDNSSSYSIHIRNIYNDVYLPLLKMKRSYLRCGKLDANANCRVRVTCEMVSRYFDNIEPREMLYILANLCH